MRDGIWMNNRLTLFLISLTVLIVPYMGTANAYGPKKFYETLEKETQIKNPLKLRDPFKKPIFKEVEKSRKVRGYIVEEGEISNVKKIEKISLDKIKVVGVLMGLNRRAVIKIMDLKGISKETYILKEGMKIGTNDAELKAVLPGGIVVVEKIKNIYDQDEYFETIIPLSED